MRASSLFPVRLTLWRVIAGLILAAGAYATWVRFFRGLGASTNLSDQFPWGLWIGFDLLVGVGIAAGGFVVAATVHIFRIEKYEPIARPAVLTAFLGYLLVIVALLFDLGRPYRIWHPLVMWNPHSVMFEVAWCVVLYTTVLALEFSPLVLERLRWKRALHVMRTIYVPLVIAGVLLSTMHQSSLGTLYVIVPDKLHGLWYTPLLPVFFFITAIAAGLAMTIFESFMSYRAFGKRLEDELLEGLARVIVVVLGVYAVWKFQDLAGRGNLGLAFQITPESTLFWGEMGLGVILPIFLFAIPKVRHSQHGLFFGAMLTVTGFIVNRLNVSVTGMQRWSGVSYVPSWMEFAVTMSIVTAGFIAFYYAVKYLPVFHHLPEHEEASLPSRHGHAAPVFVPERRIAPVFRGEVLAGLWALLFVGAIAVGLTTNKHMSAEAVAALNGTEAPANDPAAEARAARTAALPMTLPADHTFMTGPDSPGRVTFRHESHVDPAIPKCATCHASLFSMQEPGKPLTGMMNMDSAHGPLCGSCHNGTGAFKVDENCDVCHQP